MNNRYIFKYFLGALFLLSNSFLGAENLPELLKKYKANIEQNEYLQYKSVCKAFNTYWKGKPYVKGKGWKQFKRSEMFWNARMNENNPVPRAYDIYKEYNSRYLTGKSADRPLLGSKWKELGPFAAPENKLSSRSSGVGRINCVRFHPSSGGVIYIGSASGGIWKSTDDGETWKNLNETQFLSMGVSDIAISKSQPNIIYAATGDVNGHTMTRSYSIGIIKSTDSGQSWNIVGMENNNFDKIHVARLFVHPDNPDIVIAATSKGIYKSTDGGEDWEEKKSAYFFRDMEQKPGDPDIIYASTFSNEGDTYIFRTTDCGESWYISQYFSNANRIAIAVTKDDPEYIYALCSNMNDNGFEGLYVSSNSGKQWSQKATSPNLLSKSIDGKNDGGQGYYDLSLAVSPTDNNMLFAGGIYVWKSVDGGSSWALQNHWISSTGLPYIHEDQHDLAFNPLDNKLYSGNDGGLYVSRDNGHSWEDLSAGLSITQFYKMGCSYVNKNLIFGGSQDNGTNRYNDGKWEHVNGSDGMECIADYSNEAIAYSSQYSGAFYISTDGGDSFRTWIKAKDKNETSAWVAPFAQHPSEPATLFVGFTKLWKTKDRGETWDTYECFRDQENPLRNIAVSSLNPDVLYVSTDNRLAKSTDGGETWEEILNAPVLISYIYVDPMYADHCLITLAGFDKNNKVMEYDGFSWKNITYDLMNIHVNCIIQQKNTSDTYFIGTDIGVFSFDSDNKSWEPFNNGMPNVIISELDIYYPYDGSAPLLRAATFGRGIWETPINDCDIEKPILSIENDTVLCEGDFLEISAIGDYESYLWPNGEKGQTAYVADGGAVFLKVMDNKGCIAYSDTIMVTMLESPKKPEISKDGNTLTSTDAYSYQWFHDDIKMEGENDRTLEINSIGEYKVCAGSENGCGAFSDSVMVESGVEENINNQSNITVRPNPAKGDFLFTFKKLCGSMINIEIRDIVGQVIRKNELKPDSEEFDAHINLDSSPRGMYLAYIKMCGKSYIVKIIKE